MNFTQPLMAAQQSARIDMDPGGSALGAVGWGFGNGLRVEVEGSSRVNHINAITTRRVDGAFLPITSAHGSSSITAGMANLDYDIPVTRSWPIRPYVGAGIGYAWYDFAGAGGNTDLLLTLPQNNTYKGPGTTSYGGGGAFAYQAIVGASWPMRSLGGLEFTAEYRLFGTARANVPAVGTASGSVTVNGVIPSATKNHGFEAEDSGLYFGARYRFGG